MQENMITIARCETCKKSGTLSFQSEKYWCSWCQNWTNIILEKLKDIRIDLDDDKPTLKPVNFKKDFRGTLLIEYSTRNRKELVEKLEKLLQVFPVENYKKIMLD
jgi:hypothetical protein